MPDRAIPEPESPTSQGMSSAESDVGQLAAMFAAHSGGNFSAEVSADLALEIVLNEIVEQACLATGATGAAIILERDGEMVCRASSGANAPELGARLSGESGLTAECIRTRHAQRCDDAQADPRADMEASRNLGVRSVMIVPLLRGDELAGVLEAFSPRAGAFGERDELTLEALAQRVLKNLKRAGEPLPVGVPEQLGDPILPIAATQPADEAEPAMEMEDSPSFATPDHMNEEGEIPQETPVQSPRARFDVVTFALAAAVVACAVLLGTLVGFRLGWHRPVHAQVTKPVSGVAQTAQRAGADDSSRTTDAEHGTNALPAVPEKKNVTGPQGPAGSHSKDSFPPPGGLAVYENGKEVFRMPAAAEGELRAAETKAGGVQPASAREPADIVELSPEAAAGSLLHRVEPEYPEEARQQRIQGAVVLDVRIGGDGGVQEVKLISGQPQLADAAMAAVKQWRFKPRVQAGRPVEMQTRVTLNFRMPS